MKNVGIPESILIKNVQESRVGKCSDRLTLGSCCVGSIRIETGLEEAWMSASREEGGCEHGLPVSPHTLLVPDPAQEGQPSPWRRCCKGTCHPDPIVQRSDKPQTRLFLEMLPLFQRMLTSYGGHVDDGTESSLGSCEPDSFSGSSSALSDCREGFAAWGPSQWLTVLRHF